MKSVTLSNSLAIIASSVFQNCTGLSHIDIPNGVTKISSSAFRESGLASISTPDSVTYIGAHAFFGSALKSVVLPESVTEIDEYAFGGCKYLTEIKFYNESCKIYNHAYTIQPTSAVIYGYANSTAYDYAVKYKRTFVELDAHVHNYTSQVTTVATCVATGIETFTCSGCGDTYTETIAIDANNHKGATEIRNAKAASCKATGYTGDTYCKSCDVKIKTGTTIPATAHDKNVSIPAVSATCQKTGLTEGKKCSGCGDVTVAQKTVAKVDHKDDNGDYKCDYDCGYKFEKPVDPKDDCSCDCHKDGIAGFFFKILNFFQKLFGMNKVCTCGAKH